jgi:hypothetical protein
MLPKCQYGHDVGLTFPCDILRHPKHPDWGQLHRALIATGAATGIDCPFFSAIGQRPDADPNDCIKYEPQKGRL